MMKRFFFPTATSYCTQKRKRCDYTPIPDDDDDDDNDSDREGPTSSCSILSSSSSFTSGPVFLGLLSLTVLLAGWSLSSSSNTESSTSHHGHHHDYSSSHSRSQDSKNQPTNQASSIQRRHHHLTTIPTLLSLRDDQDPTQYLNALENPLYETLRSATFHYNNNHNQNNNNNNRETSSSSSILPQRQHQLHSPRKPISEDTKQPQQEQASQSSFDEFVELTVTPRQVHGGDSLTLQWNATTAFHNRTRPLLKSNDVLALYCSHDHENHENSNENNPPSRQEEDHHPFSVIQETRQLLEVATLAQVVATHEAQHQQQPKPMIPQRQRRQRRTSTIRTTAATTNLPPSPINYDVGEWIIPQFPVYRFSTCHFVLYQTKQQHHPTTTTNDPKKNDNDNSDNHNNVNDSSSSMIELHYLASTAPLRITSVRSPFGIHLSASHDPTEMVVSFSTGSGHRWSSSNDAAQSHSSDATVVAVVKYGRSDPPTEYRVTATTDASSTYTAADLCNAPANVTEPGKFVDPGQLHTITMTKLQPNTKYYYQVGVQYGQGVTWSQTVYSFQSPMLPPSTSSNKNNTNGTTDDDDEFPPFSYLVFADQGCPLNGWGQGAAWTAALVEREVLQPPGNNNKNTSTHDVIPRTNIRAVHHIGDLSYAKGAAHQWDAWLDMIEPYAARVPFHVAVGNHEYDYLTGGGNGKDPSLPPPNDNYNDNKDNDNTDAEYNGFHPEWGNFGNDSGGECGVVASKRFHMPKQPRLPSSDEEGELPMSNGVFWYSHDMGTVHTIVLSSEHDLSYGSLQYNWLVMDLSKSLNRNVTPWVIVEMHRPLYESERFWDQNAVGIGMRYEVEDLLFDYQVDLVLSGHYHAYLRTCDGLFRNRCQNRNKDKSKDDDDDNNGDPSYGGPTYITVGTAGAQLDDMTLYETEWTVQYIQQAYGYGRITVVNASALLFEFVQVANVNHHPSNNNDNNDDDNGGSGAVLDSVWLKRNRNPVQQPR